MARLIIPLLALAALASALTIVVKGPTANITAVAVGNNLAYGGQVLGLPAPPDAYFWNTAGNGTAPGVLGVRFSGNCVPGLGKAMEISVDCRAGQNTDIEVVAVHDPAYVLVCGPLPGVGQALTPIARQETPWGTYLKYNSLGVVCRVVSSSQAAAARRGPYADLLGVLASVMLGASAGLMGAFAAAFRRLSEQQH